MTLKHSTVYGVRVYPRGMILANHVDRVDTHVISAIINVAQVRHGVSATVFPMHECHTVLIAFVVALVLACLGGDVGDSSPELDWCDVTLDSIGWTYPWPRR